MSKAKELATFIQSQMGLLYKTEDDLRYLLKDLTNAVLSEPDPSTRIAELESELATLKDMHKAKWKDAYSRICPDITEEGEG